MFAPKLLNLYVCASVLNNCLPMARSTRELINLSCIPTEVSGEEIAWNVARRTTVRPAGKRDFARCALGAFVRESGEKECTDSGLEAEGMELVDREEWTEKTASGRR